MSLDTLGSRERHVSLMERYGPLLNDHQREVLGLYVASDWSLAEIAQAHGVSRAAVHEGIRRSLQILEDAEARLGLLAEGERVREEKNAMAQELADLRRRLQRLEARLGVV